ncbi:MAG: hypothetical protein ACREVI_16585 [Steroidobacteraceae bacterium]
MNRWAYRILAAVGSVCIAGAILIAAKPERLALQQSTAERVALAIVLLGLIFLHIAERAQIALLPASGRKPLTPAEEKHAAKVAALIFGIPVAIASGATIAFSRGAAVAVGCGLLAGSLGAVAVYYHARAISARLRRSSSTQE